MKNTGAKTASVALLVVLVLVVTALACLVVGCTPTNPPEPEKPKDTNDYEFVFKGASDFKGTTYNIVVYGNKDAENSITVGVEEIPEVTSGGRWVLVANKGYKIYFDDSNETFVYTKFDAATKELSFNYNVVLGNAYGSAKVNFKYKSDSFAATYDGVGLGPVPPTFTGKADGGAMIVNVTLSCFEDGTCVSAYSTRSHRKGTWSYDAETNTYNFEFEPLVNAVYHWWFVNGQRIENPGCADDEAYDDGNVYATTYDAETNTYSLSYWQECRSYIKCAISYIPE